MSLLDAALEWHAAGFCVVPASPDGSKKPAGEWKQYQQQRPDPAQLRAWFASGAYDGFGLVCGTVGGHAEMLELEGRAVDAGLAARAREILADHGLEDVLDRITRGYLEQTPSGGLHWIYRLADGPALPNTKIARRPALVGVDVLIETRGEGGFVIVAPSNGRTHPTGKAWTRALGSPADVATITVDERDALFAVLRILDETPAPTPVQPRQGATGQPGDRSDAPGSDFNARSSWADLLEPRGWRAVWRHGDVVGWKRPGKTEPGISATTGYGDRGDYLYVFSTSTELEAERAYDKFGAYAALEHGGDLKAAARALAAQGYGRRKAHLSAVPPIDGTAALQAPETAWTAPAAADPPSGPSEPSSGAGASAAASTSPPAAEHTSWWPRDLAAILAGEHTEPEPSHLARQDGHRLFYPGKTNGLLGESESGKTWVALLAVLQALQVGEHVVYLDFEDTAAGIVDRLVRMGCSGPQLRQLAYVGPEEALTDAARGDLAQTLAAQPQLVVLDGVNAAMTLLGLDLERNKEATEFAQLLLRPIANTGATVVAVDHLPKNRENRGKGGIGAQAKRAMMTGCALTVDVVKPFGKGMSGLLELTVDKDRPGAVRAVSVGAKKAGTASVVSDGETVDVRIDPASETPRDEHGQWMPTVLMERVSRFLESVGEPASTRAIREAVPGKAEHIAAALERLVEGGHVTRGARAGRGGGLAYEHEAPYRSTEGLS